jgi:hypothetical protein
MCSFAPPISGLNCEVAQQMANHESARTTGHYDRKQGLECRLVRKGFSTFVAPGFSPHGAILFYVKLLNTRTPAGSHSPGDATTGKTKLRKWRFSLRS